MSFSMLRKKKKPAESCSCMENAIDREEPQMCALELNTWGEDEVELDGGDE